MGSCGKGGGIGGRQEKREGGAEGAERKRKSLTPEGVSYNVGKRPRTEGGAARSTALPAAGRQEWLCYGGVNFTARPLPGLRVVVWVWLGRGWSGRLLWARGGRHGRRLPPDRLFA